MGNEEIALKYSNEIYYSKHEVSVALGITMIDNIWNSIINYRSNFSRSLGLRNIERTPFNVVLSPGISEKISNVERRLTKAYINYSRIGDSQRQWKIKEEQYIKVLYWVSEKYGLDCSEDLLKAIIGGNISALSPNELILVNYYQTLTHFENKYVDPLDETYLKRIYSMLTGIDFDNCQYRSEELTDNNAKLVIGREYRAAPVEKIPLMVENLLDFVVNSSMSPIVKAISSYFFLTYIKPFDTYIEEVSLIFVKSILAHHEMENVPTYLDLEMLLSNNQESLSRIVKEVQKTNDMTYVLTYCVDMFISVIEGFLDKLANVKMDFIKEENYYLEPPVSHKPIVEFDEKEYNTSLSGEAKDVVRFEMNVALPKMPVGLEENDARKIEEHLVEIYPTLKRGQAYFYARHCTIGKYYTISQYKKLLDCAYETARTSMDNLVDLGFYRKERLNNKFIYTPVAR